MLESQHLYYQIKGTRHLLPRYEPFYASLLVHEVVIPENWKTLEMPEKINKRNKGYVQEILEPVNAQEVPVALLASCPSPPPFRTPSISDPAGWLYANNLPPFRLRQTDVKAGHFERKVQALENERDQWETKYEEMAKKHAALQKDLEDLQNEIGNI